jgi:hypothetical protein
MKNNPKEYQITWNEFLGYFVYTGPGGSENSNGSFKAMRDYEK